MVGYLVTITYAGSEGNKKVKEQYFVDAFSYTEAEERINKVGEQLQEFEIKDIKKSSFSEIFCNDGNDYTAEGGKWFAVKVLIQEDESRPTKHAMLVKGTDISDAISELKKHMHGTMVDWNAIDIRETSIYEVLLK